MTKRQAKKVISKFETFVCAYNRPLHHTWQKAVMVDRRCVRRYGCEAGSKWIMRR